MKKPPNFNSKTINNKHILKTFSIDYPVTELYYVAPFSC